MEYYKLTDRENKNKIVRYVREPYVYEIYNHETKKWEIFYDMMDYLLPYPDDIGNKFEMYDEITESEAVAYVK